MFLSFQDFEMEANKASFISKLISYHTGTEQVQTAYEADEYHKQKNRAILNFKRIYFDYKGEKHVDKDASNNKIASNFFKKLNRQRCNYSLSKGISFNDMNVKDKLGKKFDDRMMSAAYKSLIHGISFIFWNLDHIHVFPVTEFAPLWDEETGALMAGVRFWQIDAEKPVIAVLYEVDGYTKYKANTLKDEFEIVEEKRPYKTVIRKGVEDEEPEVVGEEKESTLPIIPILGNDEQQSTLVGLKPSIDAYDLIKSGFANDIEECAEIYWLLSNADAMTDRELKEFLERLNRNHIANVDEGQAQAYTQEIPYEARKVALDTLRSGMYEDFGALDVHTVSAGATNDHIDAAYQSMDDEAGEFERHVSEAIEKLLNIIGIDDEPIFIRNKISNMTETVNMVVAEAEFLDQETILKKLPNIEPEEVQEILKRKQKEDLDRFAGMMDEEEEGEEDVQD